MILVREMLVVLAAIVLIAGETSAAVLSVSPLKVRLPPDGGAASIEIVNQDSRATLIQVHALGWQVDIDTGERSPDIIAVPPLFTLEPQKKQVVRLALRRPAQRSEQAFRVIITEVAKETDSPEGVSLLLRFSLPAFATPRDAEPQIVWSLSKSTLSVANQGNAHAHLRQVVLASGSGSIWETTKGSYVLPGESVSWPLDLPLARLPATLELQADTNHGPISATLARPAP